MGIFNTLGHAFAWVFDKIVPAARTAAQDAQEVEKALDSPLAKFLAGLDPKVGAAVLDDALAVAGACAAAAESAGAAVAAKGLDISADGGAVAALERLISVVGGLFGKNAPAAPAAPGA